MIEGNPQGKFHRDQAAEIAKMRGGIDSAGREDIHPVFGVDFFSSPVFATPTPSAREVAIGFIDGASSSDILARLTVGVTRLSEHRTVQQGGVLEQLATPMLAAIVATRDTEALDGDIREMISDWTDTDVRAALYQTTARDLQILETKQTSPQIDAQISLLQQLHDSTQPDSEPQ